MGQTQSKDSEEVVLEWEKIENSGEKPGSGLSSGFTLEIISKYKKMYLIGGTINMRKYFVMDMTTKVWRKKTTLRCHQYHTSCVYETPTKSSIFVFGGMKNSYDFNNSVQELIVDENGEEWTDHEFGVSKSFYHGKWGSSSCISPDNSSILVFGGWIVSGNSNKLWKFDIEMKKWEEIVPVSRNSDGQVQVPSPRSNQSLVSFKKQNKIWMYGGAIGEGEEFIWEFSFDTKKWRRVVEVKNHSLIPRSKVPMFFPKTGFGSYTQDEELIIGSGSYLLNLSLSNYKKEDLTSFHHLDVKSKKWTRFSIVFDSTDSGTLQNSKSLRLPGYYTIAQNGNEFYIYSRSYRKLDDSRMKSVDVLSDIAVQEFDTKLFRVTVPKRFLKGQFEQEDPEFVNERLEFLRSYDEKVERLEFVRMSGATAAFNDRFSVLKILF